jgi:hypothetical protein
MTIFGTIEALASVLALQSAAPAPSVAETIARTRTFLQVLASNPQGTGEFVTADARVALGEAGGSFAEFMKEMRPEMGWLATCRVGELEWRPLPPAAERENEETPPWLKGDIAWVEGAYSCMRAGAKADYKAFVVTRGGKVVLLGLSPRQ